MCLPTARRRNVVCLAHVTYTVATDDTDFRKGLDSGVHAALAVVRDAVLALS